MEWKQFFHSVILARGQQYYRAGKVKRLNYRGGKWLATVKGTRHYGVEIAVDEEGEIDGMSCSCPFADSGEACKHMAAVCMAIEAREKAEGKQQKLPLKGKAGSDPVLKIPFAKMAADQEYHYFDLNDMLDGVFEIHQSLRDKAMKLLEKGQMTLEKVDVGYLSEYYDSILMGRAYGIYQNQNRSYGINMAFDKDKIMSASCGCPRCGGNYDARYRYGDAELCVHELALLYLLEDYLLTYRPGDATDVNGAQLLEHYRQLYEREVVAGTAEVLQSVKALQLEPRLEVGMGTLSVSFRTGTNKLYVVKNLSDYVKQVDHGEEVTFGTRTTINLSECQLDERSQKYFDFIRKQVEAEERRQQRMMSRMSFGMYGRELQIKGDIPLEGAALDEFYELIRDKSVEYVNINERAKKKSLTCREGKPGLQLTIRKMADRRGVFQGVRVDGEMERLVEGDTGCYFVNETDNYLERVDRDELKELLPLYHMTNNGQVHFDVGRKYLVDFYYRVLPIFRQYGRVEEIDADEVTAYLPPEASFRFYLDAEENRVTCDLKAMYGDRMADVIDWLDEEKGPVGESFRDDAKEQEILYRIRHIFPCTDMEKRLLTTEEDEDAVYEVLNQGIRQLMELGEVHMTDRLRRINIRHTPKISVGVAMESDLMNLSIGSEELSRDELLEALNSYRRKKKYFRLKNGDFINIESDSIELLGQLMAAMHVTPQEFVKGKMQLPAYRALYLDKMLEESSGIYARRDSHFRKLVKEFKTVTDSDYEVPQSLQEIMRNYQITGYKWLRTLADYGFGGILADDMGLGKTLQMISVLLAFKEEKGGDAGTSLIVSPASLVYNWQEELSHFAPSLKVCMMTGTQGERREKLQSYEDYDVLVTSYDLLKRDIAEYEPCRFLCQVLDEAQFIKNHTTAAAKAVKLVHSQKRYALTGTPIENRLSELWSIFDYLMPGFLYRYDVFKKELETPIARDKDKDASERLKRMVSPFILRRLKQDVLKDLPDKLEKVYYAKFEAKQQKLYDGQVTHMQVMLEKQQDEEYGKNKMKILAELTRIRQICCDPSLIYEDYDGGSAKREACMELIGQAMEGGHRMLVFSQFTSMLALLEQELNSRHIPYYKITGETAKEKRLELVHDFNEGTVPVFLISLKAGGTGLNLTGADVVIHYDPWWNLAVQNQATDRVHRIGQTRVVSVYKLIAKGSIEEKILKMQEAKKDLAEEILSGENGGLAALSREELMQMLALK